MSWKNRIPGCFGSEDRMFALHDTDRTHAQEMLAEALASDVGFSEYLEEIESWLKEKGSRPDHVAKEMERVSNLGSYFRHD